MVETAMLPVPQQSVGIRSSFFGELVRRGSVSRGVVTLMFCSLLRVWEFARCCFLGLFLFFLLL